MTEFSNHNNSNDPDPEKHDDAISTGKKLFAGELILDETYKSLQRLIMSREAIPTEGFKTGIDRLLLQIHDPQDVNYIQYLLSTSLDHYHELKKLKEVSKEDELLDYKVDAYLNFVNGMNKTLDVLESVIEKELENSENSDLDTCDEDYSKLFAVKILRHRLNLHCAPIREAAVTNISSILYATTSNPQANFEIGDYYTTVPPNVICAALSEIIDQRKLFFEALTTQYSKRFGASHIIQALEDDTFDYTKLHFLSIDDDLCLDQKEYSLILKFKCPPTLYSLAKTNLDTFDEMISPISKIFSAIGGGISSRIGSESLIVTIFCPEQDSPTDTFDRLFTDAEIYTRCRGNNKFTSTSRGLQFELQRGSDSLLSTPLTVKFPSGCLDIENKEARISIAQALKLAVKLESFTQLEGLILDYPQNSNSLYAKYLFTNPSSDEIVLLNNSIEGLTINTEGLKDDGNIAQLCHILDLANCQKLHFTGDAIVMRDQLAGIIRAITKAHSLFSEDLQLSFGTRNRNGVPLLEIYSNDQLLIMARYEQDQGVFTGRCHAPELTLKVSKTFRDILSNNSETLQDVNDSFFVDNLSKELDNFGITLTDRFRVFLHMLTTKKDINDLNSFNSDLQIVLSDGIVSIEKYGEKILLDIPDLKDLSKDDFFTNKVI